jgi:hypothetical protein
VKPRRLAAVLAALAIEAGKLSVCGFALSKQGTAKKSARSSLRSMTLTLLILPIARYSFWWFREKFTSLRNARGRIDADGWNEFDGLLPPGRAMAL